MMSACRSKKKLIKAQFKGLQFAFKIFNFRLLCQFHKFHAMIFANASNLLKGPIKVTRKQPFSGQKFGNLENEISGQVRN